MRHRGRRACLKSRRPRLGAGSGVPRPDRRAVTGDLRRGGQRPLPRPASPSSAGSSGPTPKAARRCAAWCGRHRELAAAENRTIFYRCHAGLQCFAAPVRVAGRAAGALLGGRTIERAADVDDIEALTRTLELPADAVRRAVGGLALGNPRLLERAAELATRAAEALFTAERHLTAERTRTALLTSLLSLGADFARERAPHEVHAMILDAASILFDMRRACLLVRDERHGPLSPAHGVRRPGRPAPRRGARRRQPAARARPARARAVGHRGPRADLGPGVPPRNRFARRLPALRRRARPRGALRDRHPAERGGDLAARGVLPDGGARAQQRAAARDSCRGAPASSSAPTASASGSRRCCRGRR